MSSQAIRLNELIKELSLGKPSTRHEIELILAFEDVDPTIEKCVREILDED